MGYPSFSGARQYDHLTIPDTNAARRRPSSKIEYLEPRLRARQSGPSVRPRSQTLQYDFAFDAERAALDRRAYYTNGQRRGTTPIGVSGRAGTRFQQPELSRSVSGSPRSSVHFTDFKTVEPARSLQPHDATSSFPRQPGSAAMPAPVSGSPSAAARRGKETVPGQRYAKQRPKSFAKHLNDRETGSPFSARKQHPDAGKRTISGNSAKTVSSTGDAGGAHARPAEWQLKRAKNAFSTVVTIVLVFALLACVLVGYARNSSISHQNASLREQNENLEADISKLEMQIALDDDLGTVQQRAAALGMGAPEDDQLQYVAFDPSADASGVSSGNFVPADQAGFLETLGAWLQGIFGSN